MLSRAEMIILTPGLLTGLVRSVPAQKIRPSSPKMRLLISLILIYGELISTVKAFVMTPSPSSLYKPCSFSKHTIPSNSNKMPQNVDNPLYEKAFKWRTVRFSHTPTTNIKKSSRLAGISTKNSQRIKAKIKKMSKRHHSISDSTRAMVYFLLLILRNASLPCLTTMMLISSLKAAPAIAAPPSIITAKPTLGLAQLLVAATTTLSVGGIGIRFLGGNNLSNQLLTACLRCSIQLFFIGAMILQRLLGTTRPSIVLTWIVTVGTIAAFEAWSRVEYSYPKLRQHISISVLSGGLSVLLISCACRAFGMLEPWYQPRTWIPVAGMIFGNTLSAAALGAGMLTSGFATNQNQIEWRLARGASAKEASNAIVRSSLVAALTPTINSLSVTGIVHLPGMMTGQILAGASTRQAAIYQVMILYLITSSACFMLMILSILVTRSMFDFEMDRLNTSVLSTRGGMPLEDDSTSNGSLSSQKEFSIRRVKNTAKKMIRFVALCFGIKIALIERTQTSTAKKEKSQIIMKRVGLKERLTDKNSLEVLKVTDLPINFANFSISFDLNQGDRIGIVGPSGIGKSQLLRSLAGLEVWNDQGGTSNVPCDNLSLHGLSVSDLSWPQWRRKVSLVSQDRPTFKGTPNDIYNEIIGYEVQKMSQNSSLVSESNESPEEISKDWNLPISVFDREWSTLSGGEAQRVSIAIALALKPDVLLLDESMSGMDSETAIIVEKSLMKYEIPIIIVTHSTEQLHRFCTHSINLEKEREEEFSLYLSSAD